MRKVNGQEVIAGVTTFLAMSYIMFANPSILAPLPPLGDKPLAYTWGSQSSVFLWTCLIAALASMAAGWRLNVPTALACSMGLNAFTAHFAQAYQVPWQYLIAVCGVVAILVYICSCVPIRREMIKRVPQQIKIAITAGVGALLADVAIKRSIELTISSKELPAKLTPDQATILFGVGLSIILGAKFWDAYCSRQNSLFRERVRLRQFVVSCSYLVSILVLIALYQLAAPAARIAPGPITFWPWMEKFAEGNPDVFTKLFTFGLTVSFVMILDIAGSPTEFIGRPETNLREDEKEIVLSRSLRLDSGFNVVAAAAGITPIVYYAENHAGWRAGGVTGVVAITVGLLFFVFAMFGLLCVVKGWAIMELIPQFAVMPTLFIVGLFLVAESFTANLEEVTTPKGVGQTQISAASTLGFEEREQSFRLLPAAVTAVLVPVTDSLDVSIASGILAHLLTTLYSFIKTPDNPDKPAPTLVYLGSALLLFFHLRGF